MLVFTLFIVEPGEYAAFATVVLFAILSFVPVNFLHPVRVKRLRNLNLSIFMVWCLFAAIALMYNLDVPDWVKIAVAVTSIYLSSIGAVMQYFPNLGARDIEGA